MKRSELHRAVEQILRPAGEVGRAIDLDYLEEFLAERAGVTWEPEEDKSPVILWSRERYRLLASGEWQYWSTAEGPEWTTFVPSGSTRVIFEDLASRLLSEYQAKIATEQGAEAGWRAAENFIILPSGRLHGDLVQGGPKGGAGTTQKGDVSWKDEVEKRLKALEELVWNAKRR